MFQRLVWDASLSSALSLLSSFLGGEVSALGYYVVQNMAV